MFNRKEQHQQMNFIRSHCHKIYTEEINKIDLSSDDDKRVIMDDGIHTVAYGHTNSKNFISKMSYNEVRNILVDAPKMLSLYGFRGAFLRDTLRQKEN